MLRGLKGAGFDTVVATPHMRPGMFDNDRAALQGAFDGHEPAPGRRASTCPRSSSRASTGSTRSSSPGSMAGEGAPLSGRRPAASPPREARRPRGAPAAGLPAAARATLLRSVARGAPPGARPPGALSAGLEGRYLPRSAPRRRGVPPSRRLRAGREVRARLAEGGREAPRRRGLRGRLLGRAPPRGYRRSSRMRSKSSTKRVGVAETERLLGAGPRGILGLPLNESG